MAADPSRPRDDRDESPEGLAALLREHIYDEVVPALAAALVAARDFDDPTAEQLDETYRMVLVALFRLLVVAYAEDDGMLPLDDPDYERRSLQELIHEASEIAESDDEFDVDLTALWDGVQALAAAIHDGCPDWGLPAYGGWLFSPDPETSPVGAELASLELSDEQFGPVLVALLASEQGDESAARNESVVGDRTPMELGSLDVRQFGTVYEGLLDSELAIADRPLGVDAEGRYEPTDPGSGEVVVDSDDVYLHDGSGERKTSGSYYTKPRFVEHLLDHALEPALDSHLDRLDDLDDERATATVFDFHVADVAMGSGGFLLSAVDRIENRLSAYCTERPLPGVGMELEDLRDRAGAAFDSGAVAPEIERATLLRWQIVRQCIYGVDRNPLATELARTSLWLHAFVPGLPIPATESNLVSGDSLAGIGTFEEAADVLRESVDEGTDAVGRLREANHSPSRTEAAFDILAASRVEDDLDPGVVLRDDALSGSAEYERAREFCASLDPVHFPAAFPAVFDGENPGFDVIVGNPPWEESTLEVDEFWTRHEFGLQREESHDGQKETRIAQLENQRPDLAARYEREKLTHERRREILQSGPYPGMGTGDPDTYKAFCWRFWTLLREGGHLGAVLPRGVFLGAGSADFRREILNRGVVTDLTFLKNRDSWVFDGVGPRYTIGLLACQRLPPPHDGTLPIRGPYADPATFRAGIDREPHRFAVEEAKRWTGTALFPLLPADPRSVAVFERMARHPRLDCDDPGTWRARPYRELDETTDRTTDDGTTLIHKTGEPPRAGFWPVLDGGSLNPPDDPRWIMDTGARFGWADPATLCPSLQTRRENSYRYAGNRSAFSEFPETWVHDESTLPCLGPRVAFRHVTQRTNRRTICASLVPPDVFLTNAAPYFLWPRGDERDQAYLLGVLNSIPFDWYARLFVEANVNYHILNSLRVPRPGRESALRKRVEQIAGRLAARDSRYVEWTEVVEVECGSLGENEELAMIYELDALAAHLYGLSRDDVRVLFETFHRNWDHEERLERVLDYYEMWG